MTSYQRLKKKNEELKRRLFQVCIMPDAPESQVIITAVKTEHKLETAIWQGGDHLKNPDGSKFEGFIQYINNY